MPASGDTNPQPDWPIEIAPCRFPTPELGLQHPPVEVVRADQLQDLVDATDYYFERAIQGHNDGTQRLEEALERARETLGR